MEKIDIFNYTNFRDFLCDYQKARQEVEPTFSRSHVCRLLGIPQTRSYFNDVVQGKKVTSTYVERFIDLLELTKEESLYFRLLVNLNQAASAEERKLYFEQLLPFYQVPVRMLQGSLHSYYSKWYNGAIRAIIETIDFRDDYQWLAQKLTPQISEQQAKQAIDLLHKLDLIETDGDGYWRVTDKAIVASKDMQKEHLMQFNLQSLDLSKEALNDSMGMKKYFSTNTVSFSDHVYGELVERIKKFKSEVRILINNDTQNADRVYQLNLQLFPVSNQE